MASISSITEADVLDAAIEQFERRGGYTDDAYKKDRAGWAAVGEDVYATCAIGGVEQAIWRLTGKDVVEAREVAHDYPAPNRQRTTLLYARVMRRVNRVSRELFPDYSNVEAMTLSYGRKVGREKTLRVFRTARRELS